MLYSLLKFRIYSISHKKYFKPIYKDCINLLENFKQMDKRAVNTYIHTKPLQW